jgi:hypothetical protein
MRTLFLLCVVVGMGCQQPKEEPLKPEEQDQILTCEAGKPTPPPPPRGACREGWCWANPMPQGLSLTAVWASTTGTAWIVGPAGTTVHVRGDELELVDTGTHAALHDVWGSSDQDVWASGEGGTLLHWDGTRWQAVPSGASETLNFLSGHSTSDVWAAGSRTLLHWDGVAWTPQPALYVAENEALKGIASAGPGMVWATKGGALMRCSITACETVSPRASIDGQSFDLGHLLSFSPDEVFAHSSEVLRWKDGVWSSLGTSTAIRYSYERGRLAGSGPEDLWFSGYTDHSFFFQRNQDLRHFGTVSSPPVPGDMVKPVAIPIHDIAAPSPGNLYVIQWGGEVVRLKDGQWRSLLVSPAFRVSPTFDTPRALTWKERVTDMAMLPTGEVGVAATGTQPLWTDIRFFQDRAGNTWVAESSRPSMYLMQGIYVPSGTLTLKVSRLGAEGTEELYSSSELFDGDAGSSFVADSIVGIHGSSERNIWVVSASSVLHWEGEQWNPVMRLEGEDLSDFTGPVWTTRPGAAWIGTTQGVLVWNGSQLERVELSGLKVAGLWASSSRDVWAVGVLNMQPAAFHFDGSEWTQVELPAEATSAGGFVAVVGQCESDVYLVGSHGVLHWDGAQWTAIPAPMGMTVRRAAKVGAELWLAGTSGRFDALVRRPW